MYISRELSDLCFHDTVDAEIVVCGLAYSLVFRDVWCGVGLSPCREIGYHMIGSSIFDSCTFISKRAGNETRL